MNIPYGPSDDRAEQCDAICKDAQRLKGEVDRIVAEQSMFKVGAFTWRTFEKDRVIKTAHYRKRALECEECVLALAGEDIEGKLEVTVGNRQLTTNSSVEEFVEAELETLPHEVDVTDFDIIEGQKTRRSCIAVAILLGGVAFAGSGILFAFTGC